MKKKTQNILTIPQFINNKHHLRVTLDSDVLKLLHHPVFVKLNKGPYIEVLLIRDL
jgi:hypothetical protein